LSGASPQRVAVVRAEGVPEPMETATDRLDVRPCGLSSVLCPINLAHVSGVSLNLDRYCGVV
jgi:hypothetical protein